MRQVDLSYFEENLIFKEGLEKWREKRGDSNTGEN